MEEWKKLGEYPNYSVSSFGNVRNDKTGKILKGCPDKDGYLYVSLYNPKQNTKNIHTLVAKCFVENPNNYTQIDHVDRNVNNNNINNLRWCSHSQNQVNRTKFKSSKNKYIGVCYRKIRNNYCVRISVEKKRITIGTFKTEEEGALAYNQYILNNNLQHLYNLNTL